MKSTKEKSKSKNIAKIKDPEKDKKIKSINSGPTIEEIREKANDLYLQRIERGEEGNAENDWIEAEKLLTNSER
jgi:hypothetical protein